MTETGGDGCDLFLWTPHPIKVAVITTIMKTMTAKMILHFRDRSRKGLQPRLLMVENDGRVTWRTWMWTGEDRTGTGTETILTRISVIGGKVCRCRFGPDSAKSHSPS
jgi:hypothetical protein